MALSATVYEGCAAEAFAVLESRRRIALFSVLLPALTLDDGMRGTSQR